MNRYGVVMQMEFQDVEAISREEAVKRVRERMRDESPAPENFMARVIGEEEIEG